MPVRLWRRREDIWSHRLMQIFESFVTLFFVFAPVYIFFRWVGHDARRASMASQSWQNNRSHYPSVSSTPSERHPLAAAEPLKASALDPQRCQPPDVCLLHIRGIGDTDRMPQHPPRQS